MIYCKRIIGLFIFLCCAGTGSAQINLVTDPGFEVLDSCPAAGVIANLFYWHVPKNGGGGNPDLFSVCSTDPYTTGVPVNYFNMSFQNTRSGQSYAGIDVAQSTGTGREYIQSRLLDTLVAGKTYCVTFYANLPNVMQGYIEPLGAYLDSGNVYSPTMFGLINVMPQVYNTSGQLADTVNWMKIQGSFVSTGIESYITIGNYFNNASSNIGVYGGASSWASYYYIEDVSVIDVSTPAYAGNDTTIAPGDSVYIGRPQEIGLDDDCVWYVGGLPIDTVAGIWVYPTVPTTYVLEQTICGTTTYDSVRVNVSGAGLNEWDNNIDLSFFPNPSDGNITLSYALKKGTSGALNIYDITGKLVESYTMEADKNSMQLALNLQNGIYFYRVQVNGKFLKSGKISIIK